MLRMPIAVALPLLLAAPALAQGQEPKPNPAIDAEIVCKYQAKAGTRFQEKVCRTREHWERMYQQARDQAAEGFNKPVILIGS